MTKVRFYALGKSKCKSIANETKTRKRRDRSVETLNQLSKENIKQPLLSEVWIVNYLPQSVTAKNVYFGFNYECKYKKLFIAKKKVRFWNNSIYRQCIGAESVGIKHSHLWLFVRCKRAVISWRGQYLQLVYIKLQLLQQVTFLKC